MAWLSRARLRPSHCDRASCTRRTQRTKREHAERTHMRAHTLLDRYELFIFDVFAFTERMACLEARCVYCTKPRGIPNREGCRAGWCHACPLAGTEVPRSLRCLPTHRQRAAVRGLCPLVPLNPRTASPYSTVLLSVFHPEAMDAGTHGNTQRHQLQRCNNVVLSRKSDLLRSREGSAPSAWCHVAPSA